MPVINLARKRTIPKIKGEKKNIIMIAIAIPYPETAKRIFSLILGKKLKSMCDPSRGGTGIRLKTARIRLIWTI